MGGSTSRVRAKGSGRRRMAKLIIKDRSERGLRNEERQVGMEDGKTNDEDDAEQRTTLHSTAQHST